MGRLSAAVVLTFASMGLLAPSAPAEPAELVWPPREKSAPQPLGWVVTRADLAESYQRFERALKAHPPEASELPRINQAFDDASLRFFAGKHAEALQALDQLTASIDPAPDSPTDAYLRSLKVRVGPFVSQVRRPTPLKIKLSALYPTDTAEARSIDAAILIRAAEPDGAVLVRQPLRIEPGTAPPVVVLKQPEAPVGAYLVQVVVEDRADGGEGARGQTPAEDVICQTRWYVASSSLDGFRQNNAVRLQGLLNLGPARSQALASVLARNSLLSDLPSDNESSRFLYDPIDMSRMVGAEIELLLNGEDPFERRIGEVWRVVQAGAMQIPLRLYAPDSVRDGKPKGLLIALHGMGGDEAMFFHAYGQGQIRQLADKHGLIVAAPHMDWVIRSPAALDGIIEAVSYTYPLDRSRVYVLGHSLGAMSAAAMAKDNAGKVSAAVCIAGGGPFLGSQEKSPPLRVYAGELDRIVPPARLAKHVDAARGVGLPLELRVVPSQGHTLVVNQVLPEAVQWLVSRRPATAP